MRPAHVVTEVGQTLCAVFDDEDRVILAGFVEDVSEPPGVLAGELVNGWLCGAPEADDSLLVGAWLDTEYQEGRATEISSAFQVDV